MDESLVQLWNTCLGEIESQVTSAQFATWFKQTDISKEEEGIIFISVPSEFVREWMISKYHKLILKTIVDHAPHVRGIEFIIGAPTVEKQSSKPTPTIPSQELPLTNVFINRDDNLNPRYTFDSFIVGPFNELAYAAAQAVVKNPQHAYNPLFFYSPSGLGKTHLTQAVGNEIKRLFPEKKILYVTAEKFGNDYVTSVLNNKSMAFRDKYRKFDVLIIDDIQFISGKEQTQNELFHIFNALYEQGKNIIFSSDKHPNHIIGIEDRLKTRFNAGMTIDIQEPDLESRLALVREKSSHLVQPLDQEVMAYIASSVTGSIRELEGVLNIINMHAEVKQRPVTLTEVKTLVKNNVKTKKIISVDTVVKTISDYYNLDERVIYEKTRRKEIVRARQVIMFILREDFNESYPSIGAKLGGKDHTTVIHSYEKIHQELKSDPQLMKQVEDIRILFK